MDSTANVLALSTAASEIKKSCPDISNIFVLDKDYQVITKDENTSEELANETALSLTVLAKQTKMDEGIETLTCQNTNRKISFTRCEDNYFVTVASRETDEKAVANLTRILVPTMLKLMQQKATSQKDTPPTNPKQKSLISQKPNLSTQEPLALKFTVENLSGLSIISGLPDTIRVDRVLLGQWKEMYGDKTIKEAIVEETTTGKRIKCKFQPITSSKLEGQGIVQVPEKIQCSLRVKKGSAVLIRPVIED